MSRSAVGQPGAPRCLKRAPAPLRRRAAVSATRSHSAPKGAPSRGALEQLALERLDGAVIDGELLPPDQERARARLGRRRLLAGVGGAPHVLDGVRDLEADGGWHQRQRQRDEGLGRQRAQLVERERLARRAPSNSSTRVRSSRASSASQGRSGRARAWRRYSGSRAPTLRTDGCCDGQASR